jgi:hypothetical protein
MKNRLLSIFALLALLTIGACSDDEPAAKTITDADGITIELTWITDDTPEQALLDADLDLYLTGDTYEESSTFGSSFETLEFSSLEDDGEYLVEVLLYDNDSDKDIDYTLTISGGGKEYNFNGSYNGDVTDVTFTDFVTITKAGDKFTFVKE